MEEPSKQVIDEIVDNHWSWSVLPALLADNDHDPRPGLVVKCDCGVIVATTTEEVEEDWFYDLWGQHGQTVQDSLVVLEDLNDGDEYDDLDESIVLIGED